MSKISIYFRTQLLRVIKILPSILLTTTLMCGCVGILAMFFLRDWNAEDRQKYQIGVVGDVTGSYLGFGIQAVMALDSSRFLIDLQYMTEEEAAEGLRQGRLSSYARVPDGLVDSLVSGANDRLVTFIAAEGQRQIVGIVMEELADAVSVMITRSQSAIYAMQTVLWENGKGDMIPEADVTLNLRYIEDVLDRIGFCDMEILGMENGLSTEGYYFCSFFLVFLLMSGINAAPLFNSKSRELHRLMSARGVGAFAQVMGEYLAYICLIVLCQAGIILMLSIILGGGFFHITEWEGMGAEPFFGFLAGLLPMAAMIAAMQFLLYETVTGIVGSILLQFICGIAMCYLSGCFYPVHFFPEVLQRIGQILPVGVALRYTDGVMADHIPLAEVLGIILYLLLFLYLSVCVRKYRIQRGTS